MKLNGLRQLVKEELKRVLSENKMDIFNSIKEDDIVKYMGEDHKVIKKEEATATLESVKTGKTKTLNSEQINEKVRRAQDYLNEADWFDYLSDHPANQSDDNVRKGYEPKESPFKLLTDTGESAIFEKDGKLYYFNYWNIDSSKFEDYADREVISVEPDGEGGYDEELSDWDMNEEIISNYLNDNYKDLGIGYGYEDYENGKEFVEIDEPLKDELLDMFRNENNVKQALEKKFKPSIDEFKRMQKLAGI
jgi:hypothetical protein